MKEEDFNDLKKSLKESKNFQQGKLDLEPIKRKSKNIDELQKEIEVIPPLDLHNGRGCMND